MKKLFSVVLAIMLVFSAVPFGSAAEFFKAFDSGLFVRTNAADEAGFTFTALKVKDGDSNVIIDVENGLIYGIPVLTSDIGNFVENGTGYTVEFKNKELYAGTGSSVIISKNGTKLATFKTVTDGDTNGDGVTDVLDAVFAERLSSGKIDLATVEKECLVAAKVTADGESVNNTDYSALVNGILSGEEVVADRTFSEIDNIAHASFDEYIYTGTPLTPDFELTFNGKTLVKDVDYTVSYVDNTSVGTGKVVVTATENSIYSGSKIFEFVISEPPKDANNIKIKFLDYNTMLYRLGNSDSIAMSSLYEATGDVDSSKFAVTVENLAGTAAGTFTANTTDWANSKIKFTGNGVVKITEYCGNSEKLVFNAEIVDGYNVTSYSNLKNRNSVLLNDIKMSSGTHFYLSGNSTIYGNGFTFDVSDGIVNGQNIASNYLVALDSARLNNVVIAGAPYATVSLETGNDYNNAAVLSMGNSEITNCRISNCACPVRLYNGNLYMVNTTLVGGSFCNMDIRGGKAVLENCTTINQVGDIDEGGALGLGIVFYADEDENSNITILGTFNQYNHISKSDTNSMASDIKSICSPVFGTTYKQYQYSSGGNVWVNPGILSASAKIDADNIIYSNPAYKGQDISLMGNSGYVYAPTSCPKTSVPAYVAPGQYEISPVYSFDFTKKNYVAKTEDSVTWCYNDGNVVRIGFEEGESFEWDPMILAVSKYGNSIDYTVKIDSTAVNAPVTFDATGNHTVEYTFTDFYNFTATASAYNKTYIKTVNLAVSANKPNAKKSEFYFGGTPAKKVMVGNDTFVVPDTSVYTGSYNTRTINGVSVTYPCDTHKYIKDSAASNFYAYVIPLDSLKIVDYDTSGNSKTYDSNTKTQPSGLEFVKWIALSQSSGQSDPGFTEYNNKLTYRYGALNSKTDRPAGAYVAEFSYTDQQGMVYYFLVGSNHTATADGTDSSGGCFATGTLITLADGTQKPIEEITFGDKVLAWDFFTGTYVEKDIALIVFHGNEEYRVANTVYSDGTVLKTIAEHGVFDYDLNKYVYITTENCKDYIGHRFVKYSSDGSYDLVTMTDAYVTTEYTGAYSITSAGTSNAFAEGLLTVAPPEDFYNWIETDGKLRYDTEAFNEDVEKYGLYDYDVFKDYVTYEQFVAFNGAYLKIPVEKGLFTFEYILELIEMYSKWMPKN